MFMNVREKSIGHELLFMNKFTGQLYKRHVGAYLKVLAVAVFLNLKTLPHSFSFQHHVLHPLYASTSAVIHVEHLCCCGLICDLATSSCRSQTSRFKSSGWF
jgi:hypothetical protein